MTITVRRLVWADLHLAEITLPGGTMRLTRSLGSGLSRRPNDPPEVFWGIGDRGPNIKPGDAAERYGLDQLRRLAAHDGAKIMPLPQVGPALARFRRTGAAIQLEGVWPLSDPNGAALSGLPVPYGLHAEFEPVFGLDGAALSTDPQGTDSEGLAMLADGSCWIAEEYGPSLLNVAADGQVIRRWIPQGAEACFAGGAVPVQAVLPALAVSRKLNRGFEGIALSPDQASLFVAFQSPLAHPDRAAHAASRLVRIWQLDAASGALQAEFAYPLELPSAFRRDAALNTVSQSDVKVSELQMLGAHELLVLERITQSTRIYRVTLDSALVLPDRFLQPETRPSLEQIAPDDWAACGIIPLTKQLLFDTDAHPEVCGDLEGMVLLGPGELLLSNDSDFGIEGAGTQFWLVAFDPPL